MLEKISDWFDRLLLFLSASLLLVFAVGTMFGLLGVMAYAVGRQLKEWLEFGYFPARDGFWLYSLSYCGENWCIPQSLTLTDWVGVNRVINWVLDIHVVVYCFVLGWVAYAIALEWTNVIGNWNQTRQ